MKTYPLLIFNAIFFVILDKYGQLTWGTSVSGTLAFGFGGSVHYGSVNTMFEIPE